MWRNTDMIRNEVIQYTEVLNYIFIWKYTNETKYCKLRTLAFFTSGQNGEILSF